MKSNLFHYWKLPPAWLRFLIIILLLLGVFFRFANLERKVYWHDEVYTSLRAAGYTEAELIQRTVNSHEIGVEDLLRYQRSNSEKGLVDTIKGLAIEEPQLPPLYYVMEKFWVQWFGDSVAVTRSLSALISLFVLPCLYWLCMELFESPLIGWIAIALMAISPFHVLYAQEARPYSLWTLTILLSSAALLRAMRLKTQRSWGVYAATIALGLYSFLFSGLIILSHGIYLVMTEVITAREVYKHRDILLGGSLQALLVRFSKTLGAFALASVAGLLAFVPWLLVIVANLHQAQKATAWMTSRQSLPDIVKSWYQALSSVFVDLWNVNDFFPNSQLPNLGFAKYLGLPVLILIGYSVYFLCRKTPPQVWLFVLTLAGVTALALTLPDLILGGRRSHTYRYLIPCYLGVQLAVAYLFAQQISAFSGKVWQQRVWQLIMLTIISMGVLSCAISSQAQAWWNKYTEVNNYQTAQIINKSPRPLLISGSEIGYIMSLSHYLDDKVRLLLLPAEPKTQLKLPKLPNGFSDVFLFQSHGHFKVSPSADKKLRDKLVKQYKYKLKQIYQPGGLWRVEKK